MNVSTRRAIAAAAGATVGVAGWLITEVVQHPGDRLFGPNPGDAAFAAMIYAAPILTSAAVGWALAARRPQTSSQAFACAALAGGVAGGAGTFAIAAAAAAQLLNPLHAGLTFLWVLVFGVIRVGPAALAAGWLTVFLADRWARQG